MTARPHLAADPTALPRPSARVSRVAELLDCDDGDVRRLVDGGELEAHGLGKRGLRVYLDSVAAYQEARRRPAVDAKSRVKIRRAKVSQVISRTSEESLRKTGILP